MNLTDWIVILLTALCTLAYCCTRRRASWSLENRARRRAGIRLLVQAVIALWAASLIVARGLLTVNGFHGLKPDPQAMLLGALVLVVCSCYWSIRGGKLLKPVRLFAA
ncbi:hypothetical protein QS306_06310 [Paraburkholderia bonniea]|uniref:hypothetical protein n=1 Tax=Paraburkholderia bonniea TaxID=2152891 RepID=UPI0025736207|nr:hypothetical protein [Paraburkholderia bonniea]WJF91242.1 hypothetical protein QS306_06310 [Paraburkholderia bonniea]WJF94557.1 hypothetical protein QS308_06320 [Paraburkholderia bonniea]